MKKRLREEALKKQILSRNPDDSESYSKAKNACTAEVRKAQSTYSASATYPSLPSSMVTRDPSLSVTSYTHHG
jgi:hypothetical protein